MPQLGRNLFSTIVADMNNAYITHKSLIQWVVDLVLWLFLPVIGGFMGIATFIAFESDKLTFHHMGLNQSSLYQGSMLFLKSILFSSIFGPHFFKVDPDLSTYYPQRDMTPTNIPETVTAPAEDDVVVEEIAVEVDSEPTVDQIDSEAEDDLLDNADPKDVDVTEADEEEPFGEDGFDV